MKIKRATTEPFFASITIGAMHGYTNDKIFEKDIIEFIQTHQERLIEELHLYLSVCLSECKIILSGQVEPHYKLSFINYPRFPSMTEIMRKEVEELAKALMEKFDQNRIVIEFPEETVMFEQSDKVDHRIKGDPQILNRLTEISAEESGDAF